MELKNFDYIQEKHSINSEDDINFKRNKTNRPNKPLIINFFEQGTPNSQPSGLWSYPNDVSSNYKNLSYWIDLAKKAEKAKVNSIFIADVLGSYDVYKGPDNFEIGLKAGVQHPGIAPEISVPVMAAATKNLGFGITFSTISEHPYLFSRRLATLDFMTNGRIGWNVVSSYLDSAGKNLLNGEMLPKKSDRYKRAEEYVQVVNELLLSSWRIDAVKNDSKLKVYVDPKLVRKINFKGEYFKIPGPSYTEPSPQGIPVLFQSGTSSQGIELGGKIGEVIFCNGGTLNIIKKKIHSIKQIAIKYNRNPENLKIITLAMVIVGKTTEEAWNKFYDLQKHANPEGALALIGGWCNIDFSKYDDNIDLTKIENITHREIVKQFCYKIPYKGPITKKEFGKFISVKGSTDLFIGSVKDVVDEIEQWYQAGVDGFNFAAATTPGSFDDLCDYVIPELRKRGLAWKDYPVQEGTFRENLYGKKGQTFLPKDHPYNKYRWTTGIKQEFEEQLNVHKAKLFQQGNAKINLTK